MLSSVITKYLKGFDLSSLAQSTGFVKRQGGKIKPFDFLLSFFLAVSTRQFSLRKWSLELSQLIGQEISFQAIDKKLSYRHLIFIKQLFSLSIQKSDPFNSFQETEILKKYNRVLVEDSTIIKLSQQLYYHFSGVSNGKSKFTNARIQLCLNLKDGAFENVDLCTYSQNDTSYSDNILNRLQKNDLIIRDLGYWKKSVLIAIDELDSFFISRLRSNTKLYKSLDNEDFNLVDKLKSLDLKGIKEFEYICRLDPKKENTFRIVGVKVNPDQLKQRKTNVIKSRHKDCKMTPNSEYLLNWSIYITNVSQQDVYANEIYKLYRLRWHIEMVFKNWKSNFNIQELLASSLGKCPAKVEMKMYLSLIYIVMIYQPTYNAFSKKIYHEKKKILSPLKYGQFLIDNLSILIKTNYKNILNKLTRYCCYENRKDRKNYYQFRYKLKLG